MVIEMEESVNKKHIAVGNAIANEKTLERKLLKAREETNSNWHQKPCKRLMPDAMIFAKRRWRKSLVE